MTARCDERKRARSRRLAHAADGNERADLGKEQPLSETPLRYPEPPDREDEQTTSLPPFEPALEDDEQDGDEDDS
jgi:hypothetical protein